MKPFIICKLIIVGFLLKTGAVFASEVKTDPISSQKKAEIKISGAVIGKDNLPLAGATVTIKGTNQSTTTKQNGTYELVSKESSGIIVVTFVGYQSKEIPFSGGGIYNVSLEPVPDAMEEVVVIAYGTVKKQDLTGSVGLVDMDDLTKAPVASFTEALAGRVAGVQVSTNDGQPGSSQQIVIRGAGSLTQSNAPLYVIDGFPMEDFDASSLNPEDISSITVLKDASATALYGARAANGVIVVETKKGKVSKPIIDIKSTLGYQDIRKQLDVMDPYEFVKYQYELNPETTNRLYLTEGRTIDSYKEIPGINWQDHVFRTALNQNHNISIRGGVNGTRYSVSGSIFDQKGVIINSGFKRHQWRLSLDQDISKKIQMGVIANYANSTADGLPVSGGTNNVSDYLFYNTWGYRPVTGGDDNDLLSEIVDDDIINANQIRVNPLLTAKNTYNKFIVKNISINAYATYKITKDLVLKVNAAKSEKNQRNEVFYNSQTSKGSPKNPVNSRGVNGRISFAEFNNWSNENTLTYNKTFHKVHKLNVLGGFSMSGSTRDNYGYSSQLLPNESLGMSGLDQGTPLSLTASTSKSTLMSFFSRINYGYKSRYLFTGTIRADGSSKFAPANRWGYFPSGAFAWNMTEENFLKSVSVLSTSKLRVSYGHTGNNRVGDFDYLPGLNMPANITASFNNGTPSSAVIFENLGNENLKWETTRQWDIGYDLGLFKDRVRVTVDLYRKTTFDLLLNAQLPYTTGFATAFKNIGKVRNEGLEFGFNTVNVKTSKFTWESSFNIAFNRSEVLELVEGQNKRFSSALFAAQYDNSPLWVAEIGKPISVFNGFVFDGVYQYEDFNSPNPGTYILKAEVPTNGNPRESIKPGDIKYKDLNNDGVVNTLDQTTIGRAIPLHVGGFNNNFSYKGFSLNLFFQWSYGNKIYNANRLLMDGNALMIANLNQFATYENRWTPENPSNEYFRTGGQGPLGYHSSRVLEDGSYLRLKTLSLSYHVPNNLIKRLYIKDLLLQASAQNLLTFTNYTGMDPEVSVRNSALTPGFDYSAYPQAQTIMFGVKATF